MPEIVLRSPAKLNLFLKVLNKREDGYHNIVTLFERINLFDEIHLRSNESGAVHIDCDHRQVPKGPKNLVYKAARLLQKDLGVHQGVEIKIKKRIPVAAGLAGGSSNAASVLLGLNRIWALRLSRPKLLSYACQIGSDVAFFLYDCPWAVGHGRGDIIKEVNIKTKLWHVLITPRITLHSGEVYGGFSKGTYTNLLTTRKDNVSILIHNLKKNNIGGAAQRFVNDLEPVVMSVCPSLLQLKEKLKSLNTQGVMISGSGPSLFGLTATKKEAERIKGLLAKRFAQVFVVRTF